MTYTSNHTFIHLRVHSSYSLLEGAITIKKLPALCQKNNMPAVALTDTNNLFGALEFSETLADNGIQPIVGIQIDLNIADYLHDNTGHPVLAPVLLLVKNANGYQNLLKIASRAYTHHSVDGGLPFTTLHDLRHWHQDLILLTGGYDGALSQLCFKQNPAQSEQLVQDFIAIFHENCYIELQRLHLPHEQELEKFLCHLAYKYHIPLVATNNVMFATPDMAAAHDALICIAGGAFVADLDRRRVSKEQYFKSPQQMQELFADLPEALENTVLIAQKCAFKVKKHPPMLPAFVQGGDLEAEALELRKQAHEGLTERLKKPALFATPEEYRQRLDFELDVICNMKFPGYFLIVADFIKWAKSQNIPVGPGRGSGAGSMVAYALTITGLDPFQFGLLFERFLNPERVSMPDFDIDFCQDRREEVIQYVQQRYGKQQVAQIITFGKLQARAVMRDVGRVLQMPYSQVDRLCKLIPNNPAHPMTILEAIESEEALQIAKNTEDTVDKMLEIAIPLEGLYRHASTHAAGVIISDKPLDDVVPVYRDPKSDMPVTQFNMKWVEPAGMVKFDFLGLKTLTVIQKAIYYVAQRGVIIDIDTIDFTDSKTFELLSKGEATGIFQLESAGMRDVLRKMKPDSIEDIIALVSLYRPGPMDNIPVYIDVKRGDKKADYLHPSLEKTLTETYGVIIYQEQVMQIAQILSGYSLGEADLLRRAMGKKIKSEMDEQRLRFVDGAIKNNVPEKQAGMIFDLLAKFAGYGFNKSHAAAYAVISYQTAYLKANYPTEFMAAVMTYDMSNTDKLMLDKQEVRRLGLTLVPPCVNKSFTEFMPEGDKIYYALAAIKNVGENAMGLLVDERLRNGDFKDIYDFIERVDSAVLNKRTLEFLIKAGALDCFGGNRKQLIESLESLLKDSSRQQQEKQTGQNSLFGGDTAPLARPALAQTSDFSVFDRLDAEHSALGFYLSSHPLDNMQEILEQYHVMSYAGLVARLQEIPKVSTYLAGTVASKKEKKSQKGNRYAFLGLSDASGNYEVTLFSDVLAGSREFLETGVSVLLSVEATLEEEQPRVRVNHIKRIEDIDDVQNFSAVTVEITNEEAISPFKELLNKKGNTKIYVQMMHQDKIITLLLPHRYSISAGMYQKMQNLQGIRRVVSG